MGILLSYPRGRNVQNIHVSQLQIDMLPPVSRNLERLFKFLACIKSKTCSRAFFIVAQPSPPALSYENNVMFNDKLYIFTHLKLCLGTATDNYEWLKNNHICYWKPNNCKY